MFPINPYHRDLTKPTFIFQHGGAEVVEVEAEKTVKETAEAEPTPPERIDKFKNDYNPEMWEREIKSHIKGLAPKTTSEKIINRLVRDSLVRYKTKYIEVRNRLYDVKENHDKLLNEIKEKTGKERELLSDAIKNLQQVHKTRPEFEKVSPKTEKTTWVKKIPIVGKPLEAGIPIFSYPTYSTGYREYVKFQDETKDKFSKFLGALNNQYFNFEWQKAAEESKPEDAFDEYRTLAGDKWYKSGFKDGMEDYLENQLTYIFNQKTAKNPEWLKQKLAGLENRLTERYKLYANEDGFIDLAELKNLERGAKKYIDVIQLVNSGENIAKIAKQAEYKEFFDNESWHKATDTITEHLIADAKRNCTEASFIKAVQEMSGNSEEMSFSDAISEFRDIMSKKADAGVKETITAVEKINKAVNGKLTLDHIQPASIHNMVRQERALLLGGFTKPTGRYDRMVVDFISTDRNGRDIMLSNPNDQHELFLAIQNVLTHYPKIYNKDYKKSLPKERSQLTNSRNPDDPHEHNKAARLLAVITLAEEAKWVIENFDKSEKHKDKEQGLLTALKDTPPDKVPPDIMKFRDVNKLHSTSYISALSRGGFNGRDMLMGAGKILAALTVFANLMQARKQGRLFSLDHIKNPALIAAGFGWIAIDKYGKNKQYAGFLSKGAGDRMRMQDHSALDELAKNAGYKRLKRFINTKEEFAVMKDLSEHNPKAIEKLLKKARERDPKNPKLKKVDLEEFITDKKTYNLLPEKSNDHVRYLFYKTFLTKERNIHANLEPNCEAWT